MLETIKSEILEISNQYVIYSLDTDKGLCWLFDIQKGTSFKLNKVSFFILSCIDGKSSNLEILHKLYLKYPHEEQEKIFNDFKNLIRIFKKQHIVKII